MSRFTGPNANPRYLLVPNKELELDDKAYSRKQLDNWLAIERWSRVDPPYQIIVHHVTPSSGDESDRFYVPEKAAFIKALCTVSVAGSTTSTVDVHLNGAALTPAVSFSLASTVHVATPITVHTLVDPIHVDYFTVIATTVGTGAAGFIVYLIFQPVV